MLVLVHEVVCTHGDFSVEAEFRHAVTQSSDEPGGLLFTPLGRNVHIKGDHRHIAEIWRTLLGTRVPHKRPVKTLKIPMKSLQKRRRVTVRQRMRLITINPTVPTNDHLEQKPMVQTVAKAALPQSNSGLLVPVNASAKHHSSDESDSKSGSSPTCLSPSSEPPVDNIVDCITYNGLPSSASRRETVAWLMRKRFITHQQTLVNFSASDLLRLTRDDLIQICGLADGIRLYNALHAKRIEPRLTIFARGMEDPDIYTAIYMHSYTAIELRNKLTAFIGAQYEVKELYMSPATGARVRITDDVVRHMRDQTSFYVRPIKPLKQSEGGSALLLIPTEH